MAKLKQDFLCVPDGEIYPVQYRAGDTVTGSVLRAAAQLGILERSPEPEPLETKPAPLVKRNSPVRNKRGR